MHRGPRFIGTGCILVESVFKQFMYREQILTSSSDRSGRWTCTLNSSRPAFSAAMEGGPMEPPSIPGPVDNTLCGTSPAQIRLPRRTLTSLHWLSISISFRNHYLHLCFSNSGPRAENSPQSLITAREKLVAHLSS